MFRYKVFLTVADKLSFTKAAQELQISQPAVSKNIGELEKEFALELFHRENGRISLTPDGEALRRRAERLISCKRELDEEMRLRRGLCEGELRLGAEAIAAKYILPRIAAGFKSVFPQIRISLVSESKDNLLAGLGNEKIDLALIEGGEALDSEENKLQTSFFAEDRIVAATSSKNGANKLGAAAAAVVPMVLTDSMSEELASSDFVQAIAGLNILMTLPDEESVIGYLKASPECFTLIAESALRDRLGEGGLKIIDIEGLRIGRKLDFVLRNEDSDGICKRFVEFAKLRGGADSIQK